MRSGRTSPADSSTRGQVCAAYSRLQVDHRRSAEFIDKPAAGAEAMTVGAGLDPGTDLGPLVSAEQVARVDSLVRAGREAGADLATGSTRSTALVNSTRRRSSSGVQQEMTIAREEIFGPVMSLITVDDADDPDQLAMLANDSDFGLAAGVWSRDIHTVNRLAAQIRSGTVYLDLPPVMDAAAPWGGVGGSGLGRELGWVGRDRRVHRVEEHLERSVAGGQAPRDSSPWDDDTGVTDTALQTETPGHCLPGRSTNSGNRARICSVYQW